MANIHLRATLLSLALALIVHAAAMEATVVNIRDGTTVNSTAGDEPLVRMACDTRRRTGVRGDA